jgi:hypothetical protein
MTFASCPCKGKVGPRVRTALDALDRGINGAGGGLQTENRLYGKPAENRPLHALKMRQVRSPAFLPRVEETGSD